MPSRSASRAREGSQSQAVVPFDAKGAATKLTEALDRRLPEIASFLMQPENSKEVERFRMVALDAIVRDQNLLSADVGSLVLSIRHAAAMGLEPSSVMGEGAIVVYRDSGQGGKKIAQFQPMVRGLRKLALNSGQVLSIGVDVRHEKDHFVYHSGTDPRIEHFPWIEDDDPGDVLGAYAYAKLRSGELVVLYMNTAELYKRRGVSKQWQGSNQATSIWATWPEEMMKKTVLRRLLVEKVPLDFATSKAIAEDPDVIEGEATEVKAPQRPRLARLIMGDDDNGEKAPETAQEPAGQPEQAKAEPDTGKPDSAAPEPSEDAETRDVCGKPGLKEGQVCTGEPGHQPPHGDGKATWL